MADMSADHVVTALITNIRSNLEETLSIAKAAKNCAVNGNKHHSIKVLVNFESLIHESMPMIIHATRQHSCRPIILQFQDTESIDNRIRRRGTVVVSPIISCASISRLRTRAPFSIADKIAEAACSPIS
mgnify:CR=1 FL=1